METSPNFNAEITKGEKCTKFLMGYAAYVEESPDYVPDSVEDYEQVFDK